MHCQRLPPTFRSFLGGDFEELLCGDSLTLWTSVDAITLADLGLDAAPITPWSR